MTYKKIFFVLGLLAIVSLSACRKNRTCNCITTTISGGVSTETAKDHVITDVTVEEGETECDSRDSDTTYTNFSQKVECSLVR